MALILRCRPAQTARHRLCIGSRRTLGGRGMNSLFSFQEVDDLASTPRLELPSIEKISDVGAGLAESALAGLLLAAISPLLIVISLVTRLLSKGPVIYSQIRVGLNGKPFRVFKFRSMVVGAEEKTGAIFSWKGDPRISGWGSFLRKSHLDELPQLVNVWRGEMSFIGPRPERPEFVVVFENDLPLYSARLTVRPGITGLAQVLCPYDVPASEKLKHDLIYLNHRQSLKMKLFIIGKTAAKMLFVKTL